LIEAVYPRSTDNDRRGSRVATFVLVHGAFHGAWCWYKIIPRLEAKGHKVVAVNLPGHGRVTASGETATFHAYVDHVAGVVSTCDEKVVLVGHSMGGMVISGVAEILPEKIVRLVYVCAYLPINGDSMASMTMLGGETSELAAFTVPAPDFKTFTLQGDGIRDVVYGDCSDEDVALAKLLLVPQPIEPGMAVVALTDLHFGRVPRAYVECTEDKTVSLRQQRAMIARAPCAEVLALESSHSPFFSVPDRLTDLLDAVARKA
jgi:pimeloyl-ACP methyl ester carboxylesterase